MSLCHHTAIVVLLENSCETTSFSVQRVQFESFIRGLWLNKIATENQLIKYEEDGDIKLRNILSETIELPIYNNEIFKEFVEKRINEMHSFAHAGFQANVCHQTSESLEPNFTEDEIRDLLNFSNLIAYFACCETVEVAINGEERIPLLEEAYKFVVTNRLS